MKRSKIPYNKEASDLLKIIKSKTKEEFDKAHKIAVAVLIWGPSPADASPISNLRKELKAKLMERGHLAVFSEQIVSRKNGLSIKTQQRMHAQYFDLIVSLPSSPGSIAEIHDFIGDPRLNKKMMIFLDNQFRRGYSNQSLEASSTVRTYETFFYNGVKGLKKVKNTVLKEVQKIREEKYSNQKR
jgi:hypothetical protein